MSLASGRTEPGAPVVDVWAGCFADVAAVPDDWISWLDQAERATLARHAQPRAAIGFAGRHAMLRAVLGRKLGLPPDRLRFRTGPFGKPELESSATVPPNFSLSQSGDVAVLAVSDRGAVGIDIEALGPFDADVARLFAPEEQAALARMPQPHRAVALFQLWVSKEAALKAAGLGFSVPPDAVRITLPARAGDAGRATLTGAVAFEAATQLFALRPGVLGAVATPTPAPAVLALRWWRRCQLRAACSACTVSLIA